MLNESENLSLMRPIFYGRLDGPFTGSPANSKCFIISQAPKNPKRVTKVEKGGSPWMVVVYT